MDFKVNVQFIQNKGGNKEILTITIFKWGSKKFVLYKRFTIPKFDTFETKTRSSKGWLFNGAIIIFNGEKRGRYYFSQHDINCPPIPSRENNGESIFALVNHTLAFILASRNHPLLRQIINDVSNFLSNTLLNSGKNVEFVRSSSNGGRRRELPKAAVVYDT